MLDRTKKIDRAEKSGRWERIFNWERSVLFGDDVIVHPPQAQKSIGSETAEGLDQLEDLSFKEPKIPYVQQKIDLA